MLNAVLVAATAAVVAVAVAVGHTTATKQHDPLATLLSPPPFRKLTVVVVVATVDTIAAAILQSDLFRGRC